MKVLVALDQSPISLRAAREAARLFPGAEFLVVNVARTLSPWVMAGEFGSVYSPSVEELVARPDESELVAYAETAGLDEAAILTAEGDPATAICLAADDHDVDVVVVGSHDKGVLGRLFDPSVAQTVVQGTYRPVLVVSGTPPDAVS
jgi:nucleotide-binding universal stress UspA family protein